MFIVFPNFIQYDTEVSRSYLIEFIINNSHPFTIVEEPYFLKFVRSLHQYFSPGSENSVKNHIMAMYINKKQEVFRLFVDPDNGKFSATTDLWTSGNGGHPNLD